MKNQYVPVTLLGLAYAAWVFRQLDDHNSYDEFHNATHPLDLTNQDHATRLRNWLNKWGCMIKKDEPAIIWPQLNNWCSHWVAGLPSQPLRNVSDQEIKLLAGAYDQLRGEIMGPTAASKTMFALRPDTALPWDVAIRVELDAGDDGAAYEKMLMRSRAALNGLVENAHKFRIEESQISEVVCNPCRSLARLLDQYHWITITRGYQIPSREVLHWFKSASDQPSVHQWTNRTPGHRIPDPKELDRWLAWAF